jgi:glycosyltransferase involved in cell wall biosynthesis
MNAWRRRAALRWAIRNSHAFVGVSEHTCIDMESRLAVTHGTVQVVPNGVPNRPGNRERTRRALGIPAEDVLILSVGNLSPRKAHITLLQALGQIAHLPGLDPWHLAIAGDGSQRPVLEAFLAEHKLEARVRLLGQREDVPDLQAAADIFAMSSHWEGLPLVILEGIFAANAIVATDVGGIREAVRPEENGLLVPPADPASLGNALRRLLKDRDLRSRMGGASRARAEAEFGVELMADRYERLYRGKDL